MSGSHTGCAWLRLAAVVSGLSLTVAACGADPPLSATYESAPALMGQVLDALAARDRDRLDRLAIDEAEFRVHVWPSLPAARPERNLPMSYVWTDLHQKSRASLARTLAARGGVRVELLEVRFEEPPTPYAAFVVHGGTRLRVRTPADTVEEIVVCGSLIEQRGRWKVFSYVVDD